MKRIVTLFLAAAFLAAGCDDGADNNGGASDTDVVDAAATDVEQASDTDDVDDASDVDDSEDAADVAAEDVADVQKDTEPDAGGCLQVQIGSTVTETFSDSVSIEYSTEATPRVEGEVRMLSVLFEKYNDMEYTGEFTLGPGTIDENFGNCQHCVYMRTDVRERAYFADRGTLKVNSHPFSRIWDVEVSNLRLIEVEVDPVTRASTPIPDGKCIEVADYTQQGTYPPPGWTCPASSYRDNTACNCGCGDWDPDCGAAGNSCLPGDNSCPDGPDQVLPVVGCGTDQECVFEPVNRLMECADKCDWDGDVRCATGVCVFDFGPTDNDICIKDPQRIAPTVGIGEDCPSTGYQVMCNVQNGAAQGYCGPTNKCRSLCTSDADCTDPEHVCLIFEPPNGTLGYCGLQNPPDPDGP